MMNKTNTPFLLSYIIIVVLFQSCRSPKVVKINDKKSNYVEVKDVLETVQYAIRKAYIQSKEQYVGKYNALTFLDGVELEFNNSIATKFGAEVSFWVIKAGGSRSREKATTFTYGFKPLKSAGDPFSVDANRKLILDKRSEDLVTALTNLGTCLQQYENDNFLLNSIDLELEITIKNSAEAGVEFKIGVVGINPSGSLEVGNGNKISLSLKIPEDFTSEELAANKTAVEDCIKAVLAGSENAKKELEALKNKATRDKKEWEAFVNETLLKMHNEKMVDDYLLNWMYKKLVG